MSARFKEIVINTRSLDIQHILPNISQRFFHIISRRGIRCCANRLHIKRKKLLTVHFAAWRQRNFLYVGKISRHHVVRKPFGCILPVLGRSKFIFRLLHDVRAHFKISLFIRSGEHHCFCSLRRLLQHGFDFSKLNPVAPDFDLVVFPADIFNRSVRKPARNISSPVHFFPRYKWVVQEFFSGGFRHIHVAAAYSVSSNIKLSVYAFRLQAAIFIQYIQAIIS
ncbi:hypothetical protein B4144_0352 [Bacillus atrophaeus]|nr:hypothetical protein B4144_0352 [Bacillus atrophaeus]